MLISSICVCIGQLFWKLAADGSLFLLFVGFALYGIGAIIMVVAYKFGELSVLQPMLSLNYIISVFLAAVVLRESLTVLKLVGVLIIITGVVMIAGGEE